MATFQAHPYNCCFFFLFRVVFLGVADVFFIYFLFAVLATPPISIPRDFLEKSLVCPLLNMSAGWTYEDEPPTTTTTNKHTKCEYPPRPSTYSTIMVTSLPDRSMSSSSLEPLSFPFFFPIFTPR